jgi:glucose/arabinose dehydrogenase
MRTWAARARLVGLTLALASCSSPSVAQRSPETVTVVEGLDFPAGIAFDPRGRMYVTERAGRLRVVRSGALDPEPLAEIPTETAGETGLLGIAVSPEGDSLYVFATAPDGRSNRVLRVPIAGGRPETVVAGLPASTYHNGGGVAFAPDGTLLVSNGEQHAFDRAQDPDALGGKVYRFTPAGGVPPDNPFGNSPALAIGLRNPFGLTVDPVSGAAFVTENGPSSNDEINRIVPGGNYGWPVVSGAASGQDTGALEGTYRDPLLAYPEIIVPTGIAFADGRARRDFRGDLFFATFGEQTIHRVRLDADRSQAVADEIFLRAGESVIALAWGPRGLYYSTPGAVHLVPLARSRDKPERRTSSPSPAPQRARSPDPPAAGEEGRGPLVALITAGGALVVTALFVLRRTHDRQRRGGRAP